MNVNYRYVESELRYLFDNADLVALVLQREFAPRVAAIRADAARSCAHRDRRRGRQRRERRGARARRLRGRDRRRPRRSRDFPERSDDDIHMIYTGGTTGMPKGVMWRQEDIFFALVRRHRRLHATRRSTDRQRCAKRAARARVPASCCPPRR